MLNELNKIDEMIGARQAANIRHETTAPTEITSAVG